MPPYAGASVISARKGDVKPRIYVSFGYVFKWMTPTRRCFCSVWFLFKHHPKKGTLPTKTHTHIHLDRFVANGFLGQGHMSRKGSHNGP